MSVQFGRCNFDGRPVAAHEFDQVRPMLERYAPDEEALFCKGSLGILYRAFYTTPESRSEEQPHRSESGTVITWDGRLDNREALREELGERTGAGCTDLDLVVKAYERWGISALAKLIGDWALSVWEPNDHSLTLATDFMGVRHLYYSVESEQITWCTVLDPLILLSGLPARLDRAYIAGWLSSFPDPHLTPYSGVRSVPPACLVRATSKSLQVKQYWDFNPAKAIRYRSDAEYEEHFRAVFENSVRQRLRADRPILAELSGGMDSSSIVCMADEISRKMELGIARVKTISYYDDSEPNWNERPYFSRVEEKRGQRGCHIDVSGAAAPAFDSFGRGLALTPAAASGSDAVGRKFADCLDSCGHRVLLSGVAGDEVTGGVPTPTPELADLLATGQFQMLTRQLRLWALQKRRPWFHLLLETTEEFLPFGLVRRSPNCQAASWLTPSFRQQHREALASGERQFSFFGRLPSFQANLDTIDALRRQLACYALPSNPTYERRYPYLDRTLLEFLYSIPQEQLVRPGQRRSLTRRALTGIVPDELLNRKRKAYVSVGLRETILTQWRELNVNTEKPASAALGIVDVQGLVHTLDQVARGAEIPNVSLMRTLTMEAWLRAVLRGGVLDGSAAA